MAAKNKRGKKKKIISPNYSNLPRDITITILSKLPWKVILRCKVVCKEWHDIITSDPSFAQTHYESNLTALVCPNAIIDCCKKTSRKKKRGWVYRLEPYRFRGIGEPGCSFVGFHVVNSCKGFLLMVKRCFKYSDTTYSFIIYNPLTNETVFLPSILYNSSNVALFYGLGLSAVRKQFKVFVFLQDRVRKDNYSLLVYTLVNAGFASDSRDSTTGVWRKIFLPEARRGVLQYHKENAIELNGVLHWKINLERIVCLDVEKEELGEISNPCNCNRKSVNNYLSRIQVYDGLLCIGIAVMEKSPRLEMWVMKEYDIEESWMRLVVVNLEEALGITYDNEYFSFPKSKLVEILDTGEIIFLIRQMFSESYHLFSYDPSKECFEKLPFLEDYSKITIDLYTPSFFSLKLHDYVTEHGLAKVTDTSTYVLLDHIPTQSVFL